MPLLFVCKDSDKAFMHQTSSLPPSLAKDRADRIYDTIGEPLGGYDDLFCLGYLGHGEEDVCCRDDDLCTVGL